MKTVVKLKDGTEVLIRPLKLSDLDRSFAFFKALPEKDRAYLRVDVSKRLVVEQRLRKAKKKGIKRLVALHGDKIVADGSLELQSDAWKEHVGELRLIVARPYQRKGLGMLLARELYALANKHKLEEIVVRMMRPQRGARRIFRRLGFQEMTILPDYVKDIHGKKQDLIVMRSDVAALWREWKDHIEVSDWRRMR
jgi:L-amino acid N-acyltransferase YncA